MSYAANILLRIFHHIYYRYRHTAFIQKFSFCCITNTKLLLFHCSTI